MRAPRIGDKTLLENPEDLEVARGVTRRAIARDAVDLGKDTVAAAFERERIHAPQHFPIRFLNLPHRASVHWGSVSVTREAAACRGNLHKPQLPALHLNCPSARKPYAGE